MLQPALLALWDTTRTNVPVTRDFAGYRHTCVGRGTPAELQGREEIHVAGECVHWLDHAGGFLNSVWLARVSPAAAIRRVRP